MKWQKWFNSLYTKSYFKLCKQRLYLLKGLLTSYSETQRATNSKGEFRNKQTNKQFWFVRSIIASESYSQLCKERLCLVIGLAITLLTSYCETQRATQFQREFRNKQTNKQLRPVRSVIASESYSQLCKERLCLVIGLAITLLTSYSETQRATHSQREFRSSNKCLKYRVLECGIENFICVSGVMKLSSW